MLYIFLNRVYNRIQGVGGHVETPEKEIVETARRNAQKKNDSINFNALHILEGFSLF